MARAKLRDPYEAISGRVGRSDGNVIYPKGGRSFLRQAVAPTVPNSANQVTTRDMMNSISKSFGNLTNEQREAWKSFAIANPRSDAFGKYELQEMAAFVSVNFIRSVEGAGITYTAPTIFPTYQVSDISDAKYDAPSHLLTISISYPGPVPVNKFLMVEMDGPFSSAQRKSATPRLRLWDGPNTFSIIEDLTQGPTDLQCPFPVFDISVGDFILFRVTALSSEFVTGERSIQTLQVSAA